MLFFPQERSAEQELVLNNKVNLLCGMVQMYYGCLQLSECQNNIASLEHSLTISQQELAVVTEAKKQEVTLLQERVSLG